VGIRFALRGQMATDCLELPTPVVCDVFFPVREVIANTGFIS